MFKMKMRPPGILLGFLNKIVIDKEEEMKKIIVLILVVVFLMISFGCMTIAENSPGPAPDSGDGVSDGSGLDAPFGNGPGPAPNSGDCDPNGPGW